MADFPRTEIDGLSVSRMVIGTNWFLGYSHTSLAKDSFIRETMSARRIADILEVFLKEGVDTTIGLMTEAHMLEAVKDAEDRVGRRIVRIGTPALDISDHPHADSNTAGILDQQAEAGTAICMPHQSTTDVLVDRLSRQIRRMDTYCSMIRERGMIPGLSTHMPESILYADDAGLDVQTYVQIYNAAGFMMQLEVDWVQRIISGAKKPVLTIKPMAAGRLIPLVGLAFSWATIRDQDMVAVGTMTADEAREAIEISRSQLERRISAVELQHTRSKATVMPA
ncbi:MAG TPA: hypothetical protein PLJ71_05400 [Candidatus Hydrogenedentes bacterium]|nr:hypothetical protein [Candidatus Hydrogenedentota bacterium]